MLGQRRSSLLVQLIPVNRLRRWPNINPTLGLLYTSHHAHQQTRGIHTCNAVSMLTHSVRRWPDIETELGDCTMFF